VSQGSTSKEAVPATTTEQKRKYRRHPKPDENAPEKAPSAYVLFSNLVREEVKAKSLSFTEIARLVGERWQTLDPSQKEVFESHAAALKAIYNIRLAEYKTSDAYKEYMQYLADFKARHRNTGETKRPKLETPGSSKSSGISVGEDPESCAHTPKHALGDSISSTSVAPPMGSSALQLVTSLPVLNTPIERKEYPSIQDPQDRRLPDKISSQGSVSASVGARFDSSEGLSHRAALSSGTPPVGFPLPSATSSRPGCQDYASGPTAQQAKTTRPNNTGPSLATSVPTVDQWRDGSVDPRSFYTSRASLPSHQSSSMQMSQLVSPHHGQVTSPQSAGTHNCVPVAGFEGSSASTPFHRSHPRNEPVVFRPEPSRNPLDQTETEAVDTLVGLAERWKTFDQPSASQP